MNAHYNTNISDTVLLKATNKRYRISVRNQVPYITYNRKTRVLFSNPVGGAYVNVGRSRVYFV